jgi:hypothetical protein
LFQARVLLKAQNSSTVYGEAVFEGIDGNWRKFSATVTANATDFQAEIAVQLLQPGSILMDSLSLFPSGNLRPGWQNPYPFRQDLLQHLQDLRPRSAPLNAGSALGLRPLQVSPLYLMHLTSLLSETKSIPFEVKKNTVPIVRRVAQIYFPPSKGKYVEVKKSTFTIVRKVAQIGGALLSVHPSMHV